MSSYATEIMARQRIHALLEEADRERLATVATGRRSDRRWHATLNLAITRRISPVAEAS